MSGPAAGWRADLDALTFRPDGHGGACAVHRLAFRTFIGAEPTPAGCLLFHAGRAGAFATAAAAKIRRRALAPGASFHLTSRDIRRALARPA